MSLYDMKAFFRWLESANDKELEARHTALLKLIGTLRERDTYHEAKFLLHMIESEQLSRLGLMTFE